jgi:hypothetical protein
VVSAPRPPLDALTALATPKSVTSAWRPLSMTLSGLMSRCTTPRPWLKLSASITSRRIRSASLIGSAPSRDNFAASDSPSMYGITYHANPSADPAVRSGTMCGCWSEAATWISRANRSVWTDAAMSGGNTFTTTERESCTSVARNTRLIPPPGSSRSRRYVVPRAAWSRASKSAMGFWKGGSDPINLPRNLPRS